MKLFNLIPLAPALAGLATFTAALPSQAADTHGGKAAPAAAHGTASDTSHSNDAHGLTEVHEPRRFLTRDQEWKAKLKEAQRLERIKDGKNERVEAILYELKGPPYSELLRKDAYPLLIKFYEKNKVRVKLVEIYEEFAEKYPNDHELPEIYFRLGQLYREFGAFELAQDRYYKVLSTTIRGARNEDEKVEFRQTSLRSQIEIADLFLEQGNYERASQFFDRLLRLEDLDPQGSLTNRAKAEFKRAYATYYNYKDEKDTVARNKGFAQVVKYLQHTGPKNLPFYESYPNNVHAPESHFLLASIYKLMGTEADKANAHDQVVMLLTKANKGVRSKQVTMTDFDDKVTIFKWNEENLLWEDENQEPAKTQALEEINNQIDNWVHWQKKAGNQLANTYFEDGETKKAIEIYQKMILLDPAPKWQAPIVYQLGLCFERMGGATFNPKAIEAYEIITNVDKNPDSWGRWSDSVKRTLDAKDADIDDNLSEVLQNQEQFIYRMAQWRLRNLRWNLTAANEIKRLEN